MNDEGIAFSWPVFFIIMIIVLLIAGAQYMDEQHNGIITEKEIREGDSGKVYVFELEIVEFGISGVTTVKVDEETYNLYEVGDNFTYVKGDVIVGG